MEKTHFFNLADNRLQAGTGLQPVVIFLGREAYCSCTSANLAKMSMMLILYNIFLAKMNLMLILDKIS